ncbi:hypothetical protein [Orenia marismortui]|uniref:Uncharacterized protein n=1 Tax=Orenia marismortui TaxID=46469 RepID=A0A4R8GUL0_9FIRM|nr:hypothetical protein [Orenia marismortui]TDX46341.1 hypothetical protein C7959_1428 [Orenia marismortui]
MKNYIAIIMAILIMIIFCILYFSEVIRPFFDPRYILLFVLLLLGMLLLLFGILNFEEISLREHILDIIFSAFTGSLEFTNLFAIFFGLLLVIIGILGFVNGLDWLGME